MVSRAFTPSGIILYGCIRDSAGIALLPLGVKALDTIPLKSHKRNEGQANITVRFAGIEFVPGEYVYCDKDGIIVSKENYIPAEPVLIKRV
jgi:regulator of ribonuclease activity A